MFEDLKVSDKNTLTFKSEPHSIIYSKTKTYINKLHLFLQPIIDKL